MIHSCWLWECTNLQSDLLSSHLQAGFQQAVYYMLVDVWRAGSERFPDALRSYQAHVASRRAKPDWKGFIIGIFGLDVIKPLMNQRPSVCIENQAPSVAEDAAV